MVLIQSWPPHLALAPIAQVDPPLMPFRDAGYSQADYGITVQDVVYGVWKAKEDGCCVLESFDLDEYERYERVEHGDFNWITPHFLAFASPQQDAPVGRVAPGSELWSSLPQTPAAIVAHPTLSQPFKNVLLHFRERNIGLVVRLNSALYSPSYFEALGIQHLDMIFEDGTCPALSAVRRFVRLAHEMITVRKRGIAVHCKAGLGRTGCLIGAYLIYRHGFTANEIIAYMRFMRPGMVVGPQQHWLHLNQGVFREWWVEERLERKMRKEAALAAAAANAAAVAANAAAASGANGHGQQLPPSTPVRAMQKASLGRSHGKSAMSNGHAYANAHGGTSTPPNRVSSRTPLSELDQDSSTRDNNTIGVQEEYLPAPTPGQPRKTQRHHPYNRGVHHATVNEEEEEQQRQREREEGLIKDGVGEIIDQDGVVIVAEDESVREEARFVRQKSKSDETHTHTHNTRPRGATTTSTTATAAVGGGGGGESDEEYHLRMRSAYRSNNNKSSSPERRHHQHQHQHHSQSQSQSQHYHHNNMTATATSSSNTTATTTTVYHVIDNDATNDIENIGSRAAAKTMVLEQQQQQQQRHGHSHGHAAAAGRSSSASGVLAKVRGGTAGGSSKRAAASATVREGGVRKTSGRVGSVGGGAATTTTTTVAAAAVRKMSGL